MIAIENIAQDSAPVTFTIEGVGIHGLLFESREAKTRWMELLSGCCEPEKGNVFLKRRETLCPVSTQKRHVGYVPASLPLYADMTVIELLDFIGEVKGVEPDKRARQIKEAMELTALGKVTNRLLGTLSAQNRRRVAFAQALLGNPTVILCDDPLGDANEEQKRELEELLRTLGRHKPIVLGSTTADILPLCLDVTVIDRDGVRFSGEAAGLLEELSRAAEKDVPREKTVRAASVADYFGFAEIEEEEEDGE